MSFMITFIGRKCIKERKRKKNEFSRGFTAERATNRGGDAKIGNFSLNAASFLRCPEMYGRLQ